MLRNGKGYANAVKASPINSSTLESELLAMGETPGHSAPGLYPSSLSLTSDDISIPDRQVPSLISSPKYGGMPTSVDASGPMTSAGMPATPDDETTASAPFDRDGFRVVTSRLRSTSVGSADSNRSRISGPRVFSVEFGEVAESDNERARAEVEPVMMAVEKRLTKDEKARISRREKALARKKKDREAKVKRASAERKTAQASRDSSQSKSNANEAGPSYFEKGKFREEDVRGTEAEQVYRDHEIARAMQDAELEAATGETVKLRHPKEAKGKSTEKDKSRTKGLKTGKGDKKTGRDGLELTQFIQSPSPRAVLEPPAQDVQPNRLPLKSPKRAINQIPQGGYLWSAIGKEKSKKPSKFNLVNGRLFSELLGFVLLVGIELIFEFDWLHFVLIIRLLLVAVIFQHRYRLIILV
ncbi:hypothetical protein FRC00_009731 [Tulasnella sp. 408]|nr:hypothetical protein FRC00_009731 [Tulasnella sp. 408]